MNGELHLSELPCKAGLKKITLSVPYAVFTTRAITGYGLTMLPMAFGDCATYEQLPFPDKHHRDPFERMIVLHAVRNGLSVVGIDAAFDPYGISRLW